jgi:hypothetical protein
LCWTAHFGLWFRWYCRAKLQEKWAARHALEGMTCRHVHWAARHAVEGMIKCVRLEVLVLCGSGNVGLTSGFLHLGFRISKAAGVCVPSLLQRMGVMNWLLLAVTYGAMVCARDSSMYLSVKGALPVVGGQAKKTDTCCTLFALYLTCSRTVGCFTPK